MLGVCTCLVLSYESLNKKLATIFRICKGKKSMATVLWSLVVALETVNPAAKKLSRHPSRKRREFSQSLRR